MGRSQGPHGCITGERIKAVDGISGSNGGQVGRHGLVDKLVGHPGGWTGKPVKAGESMTTVNWITREGYVLHGAGFSQLNNFAFRTAERRVLSRHLFAAVSIGLIAILFSILR